jgi:hypothetical protein
MSDQEKAAPRDAAATSAQADGAPVGDELTESELEAASGGNLLEDARMWLLRKTLDATVKVIEVIDGPRT